MKKKLGDAVTSTRAYRKGMPVEKIKAKSINRSIDIGLEEISPNVTLMSVSAKSGFFHSDSATAAEILLQTGRQMGEP